MQVRARIHSASLKLINCVLLGRVDHWHCHGNASAVYDSTLQSHGVGVQEDEEKREREKRKKRKRQTTK